MQRKKRKNNKLYIPVETLEEASAVLTAAVQAGKISFPPYEGKVPEETFKECKTTLDMVKAAKAYLSNIHDVTDEEFFELISTDPAYLGDAFAQVKIRQWQSEVNSTNVDKAFNAQDRLKRIGQVLARKKDRKSSRYMFEVVVKWHDIYQKLKEHEIGEMRSDSNKLITLRELFGKDIIADVKELPQQTSKLADLITARLMRTTVSMVEKHRKKHGRKLPDLSVFCPRK